MIVVGLEVVAAAIDVVVVAVAVVKGRHAGIDKLTDGQVGRLFQLLELKQKQISRELKNVTYVS